jgi:hypothetical protein
VVSRFDPHTLEKRKVFSVLEIQQGVLVCPARNLVTKLTELP